MQSDIFKYVITCIKENLEKHSEGQFLVTNDFSTANKTQVKIKVIDLFQCSNDKTGQTIVVGERRYEAPAQYVLVLRILITGKSEEDILSTYGNIAVFFKDNNNFDLGDYNWHGNTVSRFYLEPLIRNDFIENSEYLHLDYRIELQLNSGKEEKFVRVEKKVLNTNQIK